MKRKRSPLLQVQSSFVPPAMASRVAEQEKSAGACSRSFLHLFDEQWFSFNVLAGRSTPSSPVDLKDGDLENAKLSVHEKPAGEVVAEMKRTDSPLERRLLRTPSLPPPRSGHRESSGVEEERVSGDRKLSYSYSSLDEQQSMDFSSSKRIAMQRSPKTERLHRRCANQHLILCWEARFRKAFQNKKWRSLGDLEAMELQGFKDLGFVFDDMNVPSSRPVGRTPIVGESEEKRGDGRVYLSEAWFTQRSAPPMVRRPVGCRSGEEMKEQLRFWARAVACEVRLKC